MNCIQFKHEILNRANLPTYPNPGLEETLKRFLEWVRPLITTEQLKEAQNRVDEFLNMRSFKAIKSKMDSLAQNQNDSYIFNYWVRCHLDTRDPICPYTSVPILYENPTINKKSVAEKAAAMLWALTKVYANFRQTGNGAYEIDNKTYSNDELFGALASINHIQRDRDIMYINSDISRHCLVLKGNHIYMVETMDDDLVPLSYDAVFKTMVNILTQDVPPLAVNFNTITGEADRNRAGDVLAQLLKNPHNVSEYQFIKDAIAVVNLDECKPDTILDRLYCTCWDPGKLNRFLGKGCQFSIAANGAMSMIVDHTYCDGGIETYLAKRINEELQCIDYSVCDKAAALRELTFEISAFEEQLLQCLNSCTKSMDAFTARVVEFPSLTREKLRERGILSGDGFIHIALQAAQYLTWNEIYNTYISVDCRKFFRGRTEVNRPVTEQSVAFVKAFAQRNNTEHNLRQLLDDALNAHHVRTKQAQAGLGVNRYLYVLEEVCRDYADELCLSQQPALFSDPAYQIMGVNRLSTTSFGHDDMKACYFPPVVPEGLGIFYKVGEHSFLIDTAFRCDEAVLEHFNCNLVESVERMLTI